MSLIPSESYSFPDNVSRTISRARVLNEIESVRAAVKPQPRPLRAAVTPPAPEPAPLTPMPIAPRTGISRPASTNRSGRAANRKPYGPVRAAPRVDVDLAPTRPARTEVACEIEQTILALNPEPLARKRRRGNWTRFVFAELVAFAVLIPAAGLVLTHRFNDPALTMTMNLVTIAAAVVSAVIPIIFFAVAPTLPRNQP